MAKLNELKQKFKAFGSTTKKHAASQSLSDLHRKRSAVAVSEHEDARLTGMTRSLDRRLLALNLQPFTPTGKPGFMKVA